MVRIDQSGDLIVGDLVHSNNHAWLEGGIVNGKPVPTIEGWKADLAEIAKLGTGKVYGGRGDFLPVAEAVAQQTASRALVIKWANFPIRPSKAPTMGPYRLKW